MTALELFLCACVIVMVALAAYFFLQTRKGIAERERYRNQLAERRTVIERTMTDFSNQLQADIDAQAFIAMSGKTRRDNRGTSARGLMGGAQGSVDYSNPMVSLLRDDFDYTPERCDSSSSYSCDSSSSSDSGSSGGGE